MREGCSGDHNIGEAVNLDAAACLPQHLINTASPSVYGTINTGQEIFRYAPLQVLKAVRWGMKLGSIGRDALADERDSRELDDEVNSVRFMLL